LAIPHQFLPQHFKVFLQFQDLLLLQLILLQLFNFLLQVLLFFLLFQ